MEVRKGYKQTEVGVIPEDWDIQKLGNIARISGGGSFKSQDAVRNGIRWLKIANVGFNEILWDDESFLPEQFAISYRNFLLKENDYVIAQTRPILGGILKIAKIQREDAPALLNQRVGKLESIDGTDLGFLYFLLQKKSIVLALQQSMAGTDPPNLSTRSVYSIICAFPKNIIEQEAIAEALSDADALIEAVEQLLTKKRQVKQGAMSDLLTGKRRLSGFSGEWETKTLASVCNFINDGTHFTPKYVDNGIPFYSVENVTANEFTNTKFISLQEHNRLIKRCKPEKGDILMTRIGSLGDTKLIDWDVNASIYVSLALLKVNKQAINEKFLYCYTKSRQFITDVELRSLMNAIPKKINMAEIGGVPIHVPSLPEQTAIAEILSDMDAEITALEGKLVKARQVKAGMMSELLTGKIRLA